MDHGHTAAWDYPVGMVSVEAEFVTRRLDAQLATRVSLLRMALSAVPNMNVKSAATNRAAKELNDQLKALLHGE